MTTVFELLAMLLQRARDEEPRAAPAAKRDCTLYEFLRNDKLEHAEVPGILSFTKLPKPPVQLSFRRI